MTSSNSILESLIEHEIVVCAGCGGVGKTTIAAALALAGARRGRRVLVLTIDPAQRLADALGIELLGNQPLPIARATLSRLGVPENGALYAVMLDMKRTFDDLVEYLSDSPEMRERIFENPIYQHASDALAGSVEYSAMEKVFDLYESGEFDLIIVDTPPAQHALDFLEAPQRLLEFLDSRLVHMLIHPAFAAGRFGFRIFHRGTHKVLQLLERISGIGFLEDISQFLLAFEGMSEGFRERARSVRSLLLGPTSSFILVAGPGSESTYQTTQFLDRLTSFQVPLAGVLVNRVRLWSTGESPAEGEIATAEDLQTLERAFRASEGESYPAAAAARAASDAAKGYASLVRCDAQSTESLRARIERHGWFWLQIPEFDEDIHDLEGLGQIADLITSANPAGPDFADESR